MFAGALERMALELVSLEKSIYLENRFIEKIKKKVLLSSLDEIRNEVYQTLGFSEADEIYLSKDWQLSNLIMMSSFKDAKKICYGDGFGIHVDSNNPLFTPRVTLFNSSPKTFLLENLKKVYHKILKFKLSNPSFDCGYYALPKAFGDQPDFPFNVLENKSYLNHFEKIGSKFGQLSFLSDSKSKIAFLLTSNFSESGRLGLEEEVKAYVEWMKDMLISNSIDILVIKPHPRDSEEKLQVLLESFEGVVNEVHVISGNDSSFMPFEIFYYPVYLNSAKEERPPIFTVSSSCLSLKQLFGVKPIVGFGEQISKKVFFEQFVDGRIEHEELLNIALKNIGD